MRSRSELFLMQVHLYILKTNAEHKNDSVIENSTWFAKGTNQKNHNRTEILTCDPDDRIKATHYHDVHVANDAHFAHHSNDKPHFSKSGEQVAIKYCRGTASKDTHRRH